MDYNPSLPPGRPVRNRYNHHVNGNYNEYENDEFDEENEELNQGRGDEEDDDGDDDNDEEEEYQHGYYGVSGAGVDAGESLRRHQKKRRLDKLVSNCESAARSNVNSSKEFNGSVRDKSVDEWSENRTSVLLEVWGDRYLQLERKSLRADDWVEVAEKASEMCNTEINDTECRNRLETLKKKYKKEKAKREEMAREERGGGYHGKWVFFKKMDALLSPKKQHNGLPCGIDSGEYVFMNPRVYLNQSNALDEMRDSPGESESDGDDSDERNDDGFRLLADSVQNFREIYETIEGRKRQQMLELEKMRMDFHRELELQKKQILERAQTEIAKIRQRDNENTDLMGNLSG